MQILGLSESTPKPENRFNNLFWPRVRYQEDVDYLGTQGYWVCVVLAGFTMGTGVVRHAALTSAWDAVYFYLAGVGIRQRSRFAAISALLVYFLSVILTFKILHTGGVLSIFFLALLLSNVRGTWLAARWERAAPAKPLFPVKQTTMERFADVVPRKIWPIGKWILYCLTVLELVGMCMLLFGDSAKQTGA